MINSKRKGNNFERKVAHIICDFFNLPYEENPRTPLSGGAVMWKGDIQKSEKLKSIFPFHIECKKRENWDFLDICNENSDLMRWWKQCVNDSSPDEEPLLIFSRNYYPIFCMFNLNKVFNSIPSDYLYVRYLDLCIMELKNFLDYYNKIKKGGLND